MKTPQSSHQARRRLPGPPATPFTTTKRQFTNLSRAAGVITPKKLLGATGSTAVLPESRIVYMIRHGQSKGQTAGPNMRRQDPNLIDCGLTDNGKYQAENLATLMDITQVDYVICSPLTRALQTALIGFPEHRITCHYDLREVGSMIPENLPRKTKDVVLDLESMSLDCSRIDFETHRPSQWPHRHESTPKVVRRDRIRGVFTHLVQTLPDEVQTMAVVCHYHVIRTALKDPFDERQSNNIDQHLHPQNADPIRCILHGDGSLRLAPIEEPSIVS